MQIKDMFRKKIDREIQGVIIVGQGEETNVAQELEEYVVTRELQRHFGVVVKLFCNTYGLIFRYSSPCLKWCLISIV